METKRSLLFVRLLLGLLVGAIVAVISIYIAWYNNVTERYNELLCREQMSTRWRLEYLDETVKEYIKKSNSVPQSLEQAIDASTNAIVYPMPVADGWTNPFQYSVTATNYLITSYGADGRPGGIGVNCGFAAALICFSGIKTTQTSQRPISSLIFKLVATVIAATILTIMITGLHVPSGH